MKEVYALILKTPGGSISDKFEFDTLEEAEAEKKFYKSYYDNQYSYKIVKERRTIAWKNTK